MKRRRKWKKRSRQRKIWRVRRMNNWSRKRRMKGR
jgi:hypothetical protein